MPAACAARQARISPSPCCSPPMPIGASASGSETGSPRIVVPVSRCDTSTSTRWRSLIALQVGAVGAQRLLRIGARLGIAEEGARHPAPGDLPKVFDAGHPLHRGGHGRCRGDVAGFPGLSPSGSGVGVVQRHLAHHPLPAKRQRPRQGNTGRVGCKLTSQYTSAGAILARAQNRRTYPTANTGSGLRALPPQGLRSRRGRRDRHRRRPDQADALRALREQGRASAAVLASQHDREFAAFQTLGADLAGSPEEIVTALFDKLARWSAMPGWTGSGYTRLVVELADLPGHPARAIAHRHKAAIEGYIGELLAKAEVPSPADRAREVWLLAEGAMVLILIHGDRSYVDAAARAAARLVRAPVEGASGVGVAPDLMSSPPRCGRDPIRHLATHASRRFVGRSACARRPRGDRPGRTLVSVRGCPGGRAGAAAPGRAAARRFRQRSKSAEPRGRREPR